MIVGVALGWVQPGVKSGARGSFGSQALVATGRIFPTLRRMSRKAILAGGSGLLGRALARRLLKGGWEVVILTRSLQGGAPGRQVVWNGETGGAWTTELEGATALVNFAGRSLNCVFTLENCREIMDSRLTAVRALGKAVAKCKRPPPVWVQCSATGFYGSNGMGICYEDAPAGQDFLAEVCVQWEAAFDSQELPSTRRVVLRLGVVLDLDGGMYPPLARLTRRFMGGAAGSGQQGISWVHHADVTEGFVQAIEFDGMTGPYNLCAPDPVTNADFMRALRHSLIRPWAPRAPAFVVKWVARKFMDTDPQLILGGRSCAPARLMERGFSFRFPELLLALKDLAKW